MRKITKKEFSLLLDKFFEGTITPAEKEELFDRLTTSRARELFEKLSREKWEAASDKIDEDLKRKIFKEVRRRIAPPPAAEKRLGRNIWKSVAAAILIAALAGGGGYLGGIIYESPQEYQPFTVSVDRGQKANVTLPDGTVVWMNSMSTLSYDSSYNQQQREVTIDGECYFEVAQDPSRRFVVRTQGLEVEALGTAFNVKSYSEDEEVTTSVHNGKVRVTYGQRVMELDPAEKSTYRKSDGLFLRSQIANMSDIDCWRNNVLAFESTPLFEIAKMIERMYGVNVEFEKEVLKRISFTGTISNNSITNIFYIISLTYPISYTIDGSMVTIDERRP